MNQLSKMTALLATVAALASGCASQPDRYYTLAAPAAADGANTGANTGANAASSSGEARSARAPGAFIELAPVAMPERLARPQMVVTRAGGGQGAEVALLEQHRWASSFESEMRDALAAGIAERLGAVDVTKGGRQPTQPIWRIAVQLRQFDAVENARVDTALSWTVRRSDAERGTACQWSGSEPVGNGIDALASGAQRLTAQAAAVIARHIGALQIDASAPCRAS